MKTFSKILVLCVLMVMALSKESIASEQFISSDFCMIEESYGFNKNMKSGMRCSSKRKIEATLDAVGYAASIITSACIMAPDFTVSKVTAGIGYLGGFALTSISFVVKNMDCEEDRPFSKYQKREMSYMICKSIDREYNELTGQCDE